MEREAPSGSGCRPHRRPTSTPAPEGQVSADTAAVMRLPKASSSLLPRGRRRHRARGGGPTPVADPRSPADPLGSRPTARRSARCTGTSSTTRLTFTERGAVRRARAAARGGAVPPSRSAVTDRQRDLAGAGRPRAVRSPSSQSFAGRRSMSGSGLALEFWPKLAPLLGGGSRSRVNSGAQAAFACGCRT